MVPATRMEEPTPWSRCALAFLILLAAALPGAAAEQEEACRRPVVEVAQGPSAWAPGLRYPLLIAVINENVAPVDSVTARLDVSAPQGWSASVASPTFTLGPENGTVDPITITAPQRGTGVVAGEVVVTAHFTCHRGGLDARSQASVTIPVELAPVRIPWLLLGAGLVALLATVAIVWSVRSRLPLVSVKAGAPTRDLAAGKAAQFPLVVGNRRREPDAVELTVAKIPEGWSAHVAVDELELEPREERQLWLMVRAPADARAGDEAHLTVRAASRKHPQEVAYAEVTARVATGP